MAILNLDGIPDDPIEALLWLSGVLEAVHSELDEAYQRAYFDARLTGRFDTALSLGLHGKYAALRMTRRENVTRSRMVRWGDGLDPSSTAYTG